MMRGFTKIFMGVAGILVTLGVSSTALSLSFDFTTVDLGLDKETYLAIFTDPYEYTLSGLRPGDTINLNGVGETNEGLYYVDAVTHYFSAGGYRSSFTLERNETSGSSEVSFFLPAIQLSTLEISGPGGLYTSLEVSPVPEPSTLLLLGAGLLGLAGFRRKLKGRCHT